MSNQNYIALDIETTGLDPREHKIVEIGGVKFSSSGDIKDRFSILVNPGRMIPFIAIKVHGIKNSMVEDSPSPKEGWGTFLEWAGESPIFVAHNAAFECGFLQDLYGKDEQRPSLKIIDTLKIARRQLKNERSYSLGALVPSLGEGAHRAETDALACAELFIQLQETYKAGTIPKSYEQDFWKVDFFEEFKPSIKQLRLIETLNGDPDLPKTKAEASNYIDKLKEGEEKQSSPLSPTNTRENSGTGSGWVMFAAIVITVFTVGYFVSS